MGYDDENEDQRQPGWPEPDGRTGQNANGTNGANGASGQNGNMAPGGAYAYSSEEEGEPESVAAGAGHWVSRGGVLIWEEPEGAAPEPAAEAESQWAEDELQLPPGAPAPSRIRAVRAWLLAQRQREYEALGTLLLEQRRLQPEEEQPGIRRGTREMSPLELAMAEHEAAASEYESLLESLADLETHTGPQRLLVEYYLAVSDRLAALANAPEAPESFAPHLRVASSGVTSQGAASQVSARSAAEWQGRASAVAQTRRRVERMTEPETEE